MSIGIITIIFECEFFNSENSASEDQREKIMEIPQKTSLELKPFQFTGNANEYFRIWIVNVGLTIITLGIYSAWAKVRNKRYFYSNTYFDNATFEYLADPIKILKGRLIVVGVFAIYLGVTTVYPLSEGIFVIAFFALLPWLVIKALTFNATNSAYRNIRFNFKASFGEAIWIFIGIPFVIIITLGLAYPYFVSRRYQFTINNSLYGTTVFDFKAKAEDFFSIYFKAIGLFILAFIIFALLLNPLLNGLLAILNLTILTPVIILLIFGLIYVTVFAYLKVNITNWVFNHTSLGKLRLESNLQFEQMLWLYLSNAIGIMVSLGLLIPWAEIRTARYRLTHLALHVEDDDLDKFVAAEQEKISATGEEMSDLFDVEIGL